MLLVQMLVLVLVLVLVHHCSCRHECWRCIHECWCWCYTNRLRPCVPQLSGKVDHAKEKRVLLPPLVPLYSVM
jgi:hypothetical protein